MFTYSLDTGRADVREALIELTMKMASVSRARRSGWIAAFCGAAILLVMLLLEGPVSWPVMLIYLIGLAVVLCIPLLIRPLQKRQLRRNLADLPQDSVSQYTVTENGIHASRPSQQSDFDWGAFIQYGELGDFFYLITAARGVILFDKRELSGEDLSTLRHLAESRVVNLKGVFAK